jgi:hypothetical protein
MPKMILGDVALWHGFTWLLSLPMWGSMRGQVLLPGAILSCRYSGWWHLSGGCEAPGLGYFVDI